MPDAFEHNLLLTALALAFEAAVGYPDALFRFAGHPATWIGALVARLDKALNREDWPPGRRRTAGMFALAIVVLIALAAGWVVERIASAVPFGMVPLAVLASSLLAQRSLHEHVADVARSLEASLDDGRASVARIVGRDVRRLDVAGVSRAAIESLAENFSDGVVAPALYMALFGLPGVLIYKAVNTADSMIGHKTRRHGTFGWASARLDDVLNLPAARLSAGMMTVGALAMADASARRAARSALCDAGKHVSPNAGWPEAAMAGALGVELGGPRSYGSAAANGAWLGLEGREAGVGDIRRALGLYRRAAAAFWLLTAALACAALI